MQKRSQLSRSPNSLPLRLTQTRSDGGSMLTEETAVAVMPWRCPSRPVVMTVTVEVNRRIAERNLSPRSGGMALSLHMQMHE